MNSTSDELSREIQKLHIRLERFITEQESFVKELLASLVQFRVLHQKLEKATTKLDDDAAEELINLKMTVIEALSKALEKASDAEHEKSHLIESYGALILATERAFIHKVR